LYGTGRERERETELIRASLWFCSQQKEEKVCLFSYSVGRRTMTQERRTNDDCDTNYATFKKMYYSG
jgi:hypothetical protein